MTRATEDLTGPYSEEEFFDDLLRVTGGKTDEPLAEHMIRESKEVLEWVADQGVRFQPSLGGTLSLGRTNSFFLGGGRAMLNALYRTAEHRRRDRLRGRGDGPRNPGRHVPVGDAVSMADSRVTVRARGAGRGLRRFRIQYRMARAILGRRQRRIFSSAARPITAAPS